jgi:nitroreductase
MMTTKEAIEKRRSIRKFKSDSIPFEHIEDIMDSARLAPSGCNAQPWRFKIVTEKESKIQLAQAAFDQSFIATAPVVIVCCADVRGYLEGTVSGIQDLGKIGAVEDKIVSILTGKAKLLEKVSINELGPRIAANVVIAIEHIILRAMDFGLGSCWIRLLDEQKIKQIFGWDDNIYVVALLPMGYPAEFPAPRKRLKLKDILLD